MAEITKTVAQRLDEIERKLREDKLGPDRLDMRALLKQIERLWEIGAINVITPGSVNTASIGSLPRQAGTLLSGTQAVECNTSEAVVFNSVTSWEGAQSRVVSNTSEFKIVNPGYYLAVGWFIGDFSPTSSTGLGATLRLNGVQHDIGVVSGTPFSASGLSGTVSGAFDLRRDDIVDLYILNDVCDEFNPIADFTIQNAAMYLTWVGQTQ